MQVGRKSPIPAGPVWGNRRWLPIMGAVLQWEREAFGERARRAASRKITFRSPLPIIGP